MAPIFLSHEDRNSNQQSGKQPIQAPQIQKPGESKSQTINRLAAELKVAKMAKTHAERNLLELKDQTNQKETLYQISTQQCETAWENVAELKNQLAAQDIIIKRLREDAKEYPHSGSSLMKSHKQLTDIIDTIRECFSCPLCYDGLTKSVSVSLRCGHTFCQRCIDAWATSTSDQADSTSRPRARTGQDLNTGGEEEGKKVQCPECRTHGTTRIRIYMLEEAIRLVDRAERERQSTATEELARRSNLESIDLQKPIQPTDYLTD